MILQKATELIEFLEMDDRFLGYLVLNPNYFENLSGKWKNIKKMKDYRYKVPSWLF